LTSDGATIASNNSSENLPKEYTEQFIDDWEGLQVSVQWEKQDEISSQRFFKKGVLAESEETTNVNRPLTSYSPKWTVSMVKKVLLYSSLPIAPKL